MCRAKVDPAAVELLGSVLTDLRAALCPDDPESVIIGPVDFGAEPDRPMPL